MVEERVHTTKPRDINDLEERLKTVVRSKPTEMCQRAVWWSVCTNALRIMQHRSKECISFI
jgi:hypothetical protein